MFVLFAYKCHSERNKHFLLSFVTISSFLYAIRKQRTYKYNFLLSHILSPSFIECKYFLYANMQMYLQNVCFIETKQIQMHFSLLSSLTFSHSETNAYILHTYKHTAERNKQKQTTNLHFHIQPKICISSSPRVVGGCSLIWKML